MSASSVVVSRMQGRYWMLTIPLSDWEPHLPEICSYVVGQGEEGSGGFRHWQVLAIMRRKTRLGGVKAAFTESSHCELTRSSAAESYVQKEETRIEGTSFEFGRKPFQRAEAKDWERIWELAKVGLLEDIPADVRVSSYRTLRAISADFARPLPMERSTVVFWGPTGTGKSRRAWDEAGLDAYPKDPRTKFWCGYRGQENVIVDEFRGGIDIAHLLRWLDRYPVIVELKGASFVLSARRIWITSNVRPRDWYPELDSATFSALERRLEIVEFE